MAKTNFIVASRVRRFLNNKGMRVSKDYIMALDREVAIMMEKHERIARADRRQTVMVVDIDLPARVASLSRSIGR